jgi:hypothetical protein
MLMKLATLLLVFIHAVHGAAPAVVVVTIQPRNADQVSPVDACLDIQDALTAVLVDHQAVIQVKQTTGRSLTNSKSKYKSK